MTEKYIHNEQIRGILNGKADFVQNEGLNYLIPNWQRFAEKYAGTEDLIYEWLNDLDTRKIIDEILEVLPDHEQTKIKFILTQIDNRVIEKTFEINECVWGKKVEQESKYNRQKNWYYYRMNKYLFDVETGRFTKRQ